MPLPNFDKSTNHCRNSFCLYIRLNGVFTLDITMFFIQERMKSIFMSGIIESPDLHLLAEEQYDRISLTRLGIFAFIFFVLFNRTNAHEVFPLLSNYSTPVPFRSIFKKYFYVCWPFWTLLKQKYNFRTNFQVTEFEMFVMLYMLSFRKLCTLWFGCLSRPGQSCNRNG